MSLPCIVCDTTRTRRLFDKGGKSFLRCTGCGLVRVDPLPTESELLAYYARTYDHGSYVPYAAAEQIRQLIAEDRLRTVLPVARPGRWLDVGCGAGQFVEAARQAGMAAEGLDVAPGAVARARARGLTAHVGRVEAFEPPAAYDTITAFDVIEHTLDPGRFLDCLRGWLVPEGTLVLTLPNVDSIYPRLLMRRYWFYYAPHDHLYYFNPATINRLLGRHHLVVNQLRRAHKPLTLDYIAAQLGIFNPALGWFARLALKTLPRRLLARTWTCHLGEMMAIAQSRTAPQASSS